VDSILTMPIPKRNIRSFSALRDGAGAYHCVWCKKPVPLNRRKYCSSQCEHEVRLRRDPMYMQSVLFQRDHGVCAKCGLNGHIARKLAISLGWDDDHRGEGLRKFYMDHLAEIGGYKCPSTPRYWWEVDHILPVAQGGGSCGMENLQTLCYWCHKKKTAAEHKANRQVEIEAKAAERQRVLALVFETVPKPGDPTI